MKILMIAALLYVGVTAAAAQTPPPAPSSDLHIPPGLNFDPELIRRHNQAAWVDNTLRKEAAAQAAAQKGQAKAPEPSKEVTK